MLAPRSRSFVLAAGVAAMSPLAAIAQPEGGPPPAIVELDAARMESLSQWQEVTGEIRVLRRSVVASRQEGLVVELLADEGQTVTAGQVIARLDDTLARLEVAQREAEANAKRDAAEVKRVELDKARRDVARYESLASTAVAEMERDDARTAVSLGASNLKLAEAEAATADAALALARERLSQRTITAPFTGRVVRKMTEIGQWVGFGDGIAEITALNEVEARLNVPERVAVGLVEGESRVRVRVKALGEEREGVVDHIMPEADALSRLFAIRVFLKNDGSKLRPGMSVIGLVASGAEAPSLTIHKDAILRDDAGEFVYWNANGSALPARVRTRFAVGDRVVVEGNIPPGAAVVTKGNERIMFPGQPIMAAGATGGPKAP